MSLSEDKFKKNFCLAVYGILAIVFSIITIYVMIEWYKEYSMLSEARKTSKILMSKIVNAQGDLLGFEANVEMNGAKWKYHHGEPQIILDTYPINLSKLKDTKIFFEVNYASGKNDNLTLSYGCFKQPNKKLQSMVGASEGSIEIRPSYDKHTIYYEKGGNLVKLSFIAPLTKDMHNVNAWLVFGENCETAIPFFLLVKTVFFATIALCFISVCIMIIRID